MMLIPKGPLSLKYVSYAALLALCGILLLYHFFDAEGVLPVQFVRNKKTQSTPSTPNPQPPKPSPSPSAAPEGFPKILWYKLGPNGLNDDTRKWTDSCIKANPEYRAEFMTDASGDEFVKKAFSSRPEIVASYLDLSVPILKADWLRYMLLYDQGGIWSDLDVECLVPIDDWIPSTYVKDAAVVVGWEFDVGWGDNFLRQFTSWTIMTKPRSPHMLQVINDIQADIEAKTRENNATVQELTLEMVGDVVDFTGPRRMTFGIYKSLGRALNRTIEQQDMAELVHPKLMGDVLVMPGQSFAASSNTYPPEDIEHLPPALVTHHYAGSWKNDKGGEKR